MLNTSVEIVIGRKKDFLAETGKLIGRDFLKNVPVSLVLKWITLVGRPYRDDLYGRRNPE